MGEAHLLSMTAAFCIIITSLKASSSFEVIPGRITLS